MIPRSAKKSFMSFKSEAQTTTDPTNWPILLAIGLVPRHTELRVQSNNEKSKTRKIVNLSLA
jgi:hypothetical protein